MLDELPREEVLASLDRAVEELLDAAGVTAPPVDALALAQRHLGWVVCLDQGQGQRGRAQRSGGRPQIFLRPEPSEERHQWTVAHEIGEHLKASLLDRLRIPPEQLRAMAGESLANLFAYRLLVPSRWLGDDAKDCDYDLLQLKERYPTASHEVIAWRLLDLPAPCVITILDNEKVHRRRSNGPPSRRALLPVEERCRKWVSAHGRPRTLQEAAWTVQGWPIHRPDWKREILRSVLDADWQD